MNVLKRLFGGSSKLTSSAADPPAPPLPTETQPEVLPSNSTEPTSEGGSDAPIVQRASDGWEIKGMCGVCGAWIYLLEGQNQVHCGSRLENVVLRKDQEEQERRIGEELTRAEEEFRANVLEITQHHLPTLSRKYRRTHVVDDYGIEQDVGWLQELRYFVERVLNIAEDSELYPDVMELVHGAVVDAILSGASCDYLPRLNQLISARVGGGRPRSD